MRFRIRIAATWQSTAVIATLAGAVACSNAKTSRDTGNGQVPPSESTVISVRAPIAIGFFPLVSPTEVSEGVELAAEHFSYAISDLSSCLDPSGIAVEIVEAKVLVVDNGGNRDIIDLAARSNESIGCYLVAPGRQPMIVRAEGGASSLTIRCPSAAAVYFEVPDCCPEGFICCPDGNPVYDGSECSRR